MRFDRTSTSIMGRWWWTVDRATLFALFLLICIGVVLVLAAGPGVAARIGASPFHFVERQILFLALSVMVMFTVSLCTPQQVRRLAVIGFLISIFLMMLLPFLGMETKGAKRWLSIGAFSIQPSEFMKPCMAIVTAWIFHLRTQHTGFPGWRIASGLYALVAFLLIMQPDFGMTVAVSVMWGTEFILAGMPLIWLGALIPCGALGAFGAYHFFSHVRKRIDNFLDPASGDNYQVEKSLEAFNHGGWFGQGMGEGTIKGSIPDSHTDFVFAVAGEEFGLIACLVIVAIFAFIILRGLSKMLKENDFFTLLAVCGLLTQFGIQAIINMGVAINLMPAKGMTLPFLSYGGSSLIAIALGMGMMLALTRRRYGNISVKR